MKFYKNMTESDKITINSDSDVDRQVKRLMLNIYAHARVIVNNNSVSAREDINGNHNIKVRKCFSAPVEDSFKPDEMYLVSNPNTCELVIGETSRFMAKEPTARIFDDQPLVLSISTGPEVGKHYLVLSSFDADTKSNRNPVVLKGVLSDSGFDVLDTSTNKRYLDPGFVTRLSAMDNELVNHLNMTYRPSPTINGWSCNA